MNAVVVVVAITLLHSFGQPGTQQIWVVTCDLSANGMMPRHKLLLLLLLLLLFSMEKPVMYLPISWPSFQASRPVGGANNLRGGKKKTLSTTYLVNHLRGGLKGRWQQLTFTHL